MCHSVLGKVLCVILFLEKDRNGNLQLTQPLSLLISLLVFVFCQIYD